MSERDIRSPRPARRRGRDPHGASRWGARRIGAGVQGAEPLAAARRGQPASLYRVLAENTWRDPHLLLKGVDKVLFAVVTHPERNFLHR